MANDPVLTAAQMRAAEEAAIAGGTSVEALMQRAGEGAAEWVWRLSAGHAVTVLCGPGNNGGDGYVLAEAIRRKGGPVKVVAALEPATNAAKAARAAYKGEYAEADEAHGALWVDGLFGTGLSRPLSNELVALLARLAAAHRYGVAIDLPSGVGTDSGALLQPGLPRFDLTVALGAWKPAHWLMPAAALMGERRLAPIGIELPADAPFLLASPHFAPPAPDAHKYSRGLVAVVGGAMPGAARLACAGAMRAGAGYVKLLADTMACSPADLVVDARPLDEALADARIDALLVGPGLGRDDPGRQRLGQALAAGLPTVLDADALALLDPAVLANHSSARVLTPHAGEMTQLLKSFGVKPESKPENALALAKAANTVVIAKGPDTVIAAPDGRLAYTPGASPWLSTAGTGDVLAGIVASRLAVTGDPFRAACEAVGLHGEAARLAGPALTAGDLASAVSAAYAASL